ncbi:hypothetical protein [Methanospirillum sp.]
MSNRIMPDKNIALGKMSITNSTDESITNVTWHVMRSLSFARECSGRGVHWSPSSAGSMTGICVT